MSTRIDELHALRLRISELEAENATLKSKLGREFPPQTTASQIDSNHLSLNEYKRYGRQMIVPEFGSLKSQLKLKNARVLVVGAGGLGSPALLYLAAAGIGHIGILDNDTVDESNLHRQVIHTTANIGVHKCESAKAYINRLNPNILISTYPVRIVNDNAFGIISQYDIVVDCTDTPATRYLINDVSVLTGKTIVSGSGVKTHGQVTILNFESKGPCYRCFYPKPPKPESVSTCGDAGVFGPAIGLTGILLATETIKVLTDFYKESFQPFLLLYSAYPLNSIRSFKMRGRKDDCAVCGNFPIITKNDIERGLIDYEVFCGKISYGVVYPEERLTALEAQKLLNENERALMIDVRPQEQFQITNISGSYSIEWERNLSRSENVTQNLSPDFDPKTDPVLVICRYGNDSRLALRRLKDEFGFERVYDVVGGINKWSVDVDPLIPQY